MLPQRTVTFFRSLLGAKRPRSAPEPSSPRVIELAFAGDAAPSGAEPPGQPKIIGLLHTAALVEASRPRRTVTVWIGEKSFQAALI